MKIFNKKAVLLSSTALALTVSAASQAATVLLPNGDFEAGSTSWGTFADGDGGSSATFETAGGNGGGFGLASNTSGGWGGGFVSEDVEGGQVCTGAGGGLQNCGLALADYGLSGGDTTTFSWDMKDFNGDGAGNTGIKFESWTATDYISDTGDIVFAQSDSNWNNISADYTFADGATHFKAVLVGVNGGEVGFDNLSIVSPVPIPAAAWLFGSALLGLTGIARRRKAA